MRVVTCLFMKLKLEEFSFRRRVVGDQLQKLALPTEIVDIITATHDFLLQLLRNLIVVICTKYFILKKHFNWQNLSKARLYRTSDSKRRKSRHRCELWRRPESPKCYEGKHRPQNYRHYQLESVIARIDCCHEQTN